MHIVRKEDLPRIGSSNHFVGAEQGEVEVSMYLVEAQPGRGAPLHCHDYDEVILVQDGVSRLVAGEEIREARANDVIVIKAGTPHGFVNIGSDVLRQIDIHASPRFGQQNLAPTATSRQAGLPE